MMVPATMSYEQLLELSALETAKMVLLISVKDFIFTFTSIVWLCLEYYSKLKGYIDQSSLPFGILYRGGRLPGSIGWLPWYYAFFTNQPQGKDQSEGSALLVAVKRACQNLLMKLLKSEPQQIARPQPDLTVPTIDIGIIRAAVSNSVNVPVKPSSKGAIYIQIGSDAINAQKYFSLPVIRTLLFAVALECAVSMFQKICSSPSLKVYEASWVSGKHQLVSHNAGGTSETNRLESTGRSNDDPPMSVVSDIPMKKERSTTSESSCKGLPVTASSAETTLVPMVHELNRSEYQHENRDPHSFVDERGTKTHNAKAWATWVLATAAAHHATGKLDLLTDFRTELADDNLFMLAANGEAMKVLGRGNVISDTMMLADVLYVPGLTSNLVSVSQLTELNYSVGFGRGTCDVRSATDNGVLVGAGHVGEDGVFELDFLKTPPFRVMNPGKY